MPWPPGPPLILPSAPYYNLCYFPFPPFYRNGRINRFEKTLLFEGAVAQTAAPRGSWWGGQMEVSHTSPPSHDVPTEGHGLSGGPVANLYIALRCAGVFLKSDVCAKWKKKGKEWKDKSVTDEEKVINLHIITVIYDIGREWVRTEDATLRNSVSEVITLKCGGLNSVDESEIGL